MTVSFLSPNRYICDSFVFATRASVSVLDSAFSSFVLNDGELLYMPSWNLCPLSDETEPAIIPHEETVATAAKNSMKVFFMFILLIYL